MHPIAGGWAADPLASAIGQGGAAIQAHGPLQNPERPAGTHAMQESPVLLQGLVAQHSADHLQASLTQLANPPPIHTRVWILKSNHNTTDTGLHHRLTAGGSAAVMAARFQGHHKGPSTGRSAGLQQGTHLGMGFTGPRMKPLADETPIPIQNHSPHQGIGAGADGMLADVMLGDVLKMLMFA